MEDIKRPRNENNTEPTNSPGQSEPSHDLLDESNQYGSDYHSSRRIDMKPTARLDATPPVTKKPGFDGPALIVLQWLSYAFWGGTVIAISVLVASVLAFNISKTSIGDSVLYGLAAVLVLLPISLICDFMYLRHEPDYRTRSSSVVMTVHAVLFALFGIGSLITVAFSIVSLMVSSSGHDNVMVTLYSSLIITFLFVMLFLRTVLPKKYAKMRLLFMTIMIISVGLVCAFGIFGPIADAQLTRNDKLIESNLSTVSDAVNTYASNNNRLPDNLSSLTLSGDAKKLVTDKLVTYKKDVPPSSSYPAVSTDFYYQLCVNYKKASTEPYTTTTTTTNYSSSSSSPSATLYPGGNEYNYYFSATPHPAGDKCYKLVTYGNEIVPMSNTNK